MGRNAKDSPWFSTAQESRRRKKVMYTLGDEAREKVETFAELEGTTKSEMAEEMILAWAGKKDEKDAGE